MSDWLHNLPVPWMALVVFGFTYLLAAAIHAGVAVLARGERTKRLTAISPGMLAPLGIIFGLFVAFTAAQVWNDNDRAGAAVSREASALRSVIVLASSFADEPETKLRGLIRAYIEEAASVEWPMMARQTASLKASPRPLAEALQFVLSLTTTGPGQQIAQREIASAIEAALVAHRLRYSAGVTPTCRAKARRSVSASAKPQCAATCFGISWPTSSSRRAALTRASSTQVAGVIPTSLRNRRAKWRGLRSMRFARLATQ